MSCLVNFSASVCYSYIREGHDTERQHALPQIDTMNNAWSEDLELMRRITSGERRALEELYAHHRLALFGYLLGLSPDRETAEEILQDTLVAVWRGASSYEGRSPLRTWLIGVARGQAHNTLRGRRSPLADESEIEALASGEPGPEAVALTGMTRDEQAAGILRLPTLHRQVLVLVLVEGLSFEQAARVLGVPVGTVRSRLSNARRALKVMLLADEEVGL